MIAPPFIKRFFMKGGALIMGGKGQAVKVNTDNQAYLLYNVFKYGI